MVVVLVMRMGVLLVVLRPLHYDFNGVSLMSGLVLLQLLSLLFVLVEIGGMEVVDMCEILPEDFKPPQVLIALGLTIPALCTILVKNAVQSEFAHYFKSNSNQPTIFV